MASRVTLKDIAAAAGVSPATVSLVLNNRPARVAQRTRDTILATARRLQYVPNQTARSLVTNRSMMVALIVPDIENMFFAALAKRIEDEAAGDGYSLIVANSDDRREREHTLLAGVCSRGVDGLFLVPGLASCAEPEALRADMEVCPSPVILVDRLANLPWCDGVACDEYAGGRLAAEALLTAGHTRIGCVSRGQASGLADRRFRGFMDRLEEAGVPERSMVTVTGDYRCSGGYEAADAVIDAGATAVFCTNDLMAIGFLQRLGERGLRCPEAMSVIGYDDVIERFGISTRLTTIHQDIGELAAACWHMLKERMGERRTGHTACRTQLLTPRLVTRATVAPPADSTNRTVPGDLTA